MISYTIYEIFEMNLEILMNQILNYDILLITRGEFMNFKNRLSECINNCSQVEIDSFIVQEVKNLFNTPTIYQYYQVIKDHKCISNEAKLVMAWMAQLSGDNMKLSILSRALEDKKFKKGFQSFYYDMQALSGMFGDPNERLLSSDKSLANLEEDEVTFFHGNAYLTRGQIHNGLKEYRTATEYFLQAYEAFLENGMMFPASVSLTNALLNKARLAQLDECIKIAKKSMLMASSYKGSKHHYWDVVYLPMGIAYLEQNNVLLAIEYLSKAKDAIDDLELIHMHGLVELYLFRAYKMNGDTKKLSNEIVKTKELFEHMHYPLMTQIVRYGELLLDDYLSNQDIEQLKAMYYEESNTQPFLLEMLIYVGLKNEVDYIEFEEFISDIQKSREQGDLINLQVLLLLLADRYYIKGDMEKAKVILEEVLLYVQKFHLLGAFYLYPYECWPLIEKMDHHIKKVVTEQPYFTEKELEVLELMEQGNTNKEIGEKLFISVGTVKWHINHILSKLDVKNRIQAVHEARKLGLFK